MRIRRSTPLAGMLAGMLTSAVLLASSTAWAEDRGPRFLGSLHGGAATEGGGGVTAEVRLFGSVCAGASFDLGRNFVGTHGQYNYLGPAVHGSYGIRLADIFEIRPFFGARFPFNLEAKSAEYKISDNTPVAFTTALRASFFIDWFVVGLQGEFTPHGVTWQELATGTTDSKTEYLIRASLVLGVALGPDITR